MKVLNFGSLNYDHVYDVDHFVLPKETLSSISYSRGFGGKGINQSIALKKAGVDVFHAGRVGYDGDDFVDYLQEFDINTTYLYEEKHFPTGHAIIEVCHGENRILLHGGANQLIDTVQIDEVLEYFDVGDVLLIQNEISNIAYLIEKAHEKGMFIVFNTAPMDAKVFTYPLDLVNMFIVNEIEGAGLANISSQESQDIIKALGEKYPNKEIVLTVGAEGAYFIHGVNVIHQDAYSTTVVDTTAAGDTFIGYFLANYLNNKDVVKALDIAAKASSICVSRSGAAKSIPSIDEIK